MKVIKSFAFAISGLKICFSSETNFKIHVLFTIIALLFGIGFNLPLTEWLAIIFVITLVMVLEMINTAIEKLCDVLHKDIHPEIKKIKDITAGAVLITAVCSLTVGAVIFVPKIIIYIQSF